MKMSLTLMKWFSLTVTLLSLLKSSINMFIVVGAGHYSLDGWLISLTCIDKGGNECYISRLKLYKIEKKKNIYVNVTMNWNL